jgi:DNA-directed RNA polymerase specialized sigma24 family protein
MINKTLPQSELEIDMHRLRRLDREKVDRQFDAYSDPRYRFIFCRVGSDANLAGDMAQNAVVAAMETIDRFHPNLGGCRTSGSINL